MTDNDTRAITKSCWHCKIVNACNCGKDSVASVRRVIGWQLCANIFLGFAVVLTCRVGYAATATNGAKDFSNECFIGNDMPSPYGGCYQLVPISSPTNATGSCAYTLMASGTATSAYALARVTTSASVPNTGGIAEMFMQGANFNTSGSFAFSLNGGQQYYLYAYARNTYSTLAEVTMNCSWNAVPSATPTPTKTATPPPATLTYTATIAPASTATFTPSITPTLADTATPTWTPTITPTNTATGGTRTNTPAWTATIIPTAAPTPFCGDGKVDFGLGENCDPGGAIADDCCNDACHFSAAGAECEDGNDLTCPDTCDGSGTCIPGHDESTDCRNLCCDGIDNDGDGSFDIEDPGCGLGQESRTAVVTTSPKHNAIRMGGRVNISSLDLEINRPDCDDPYIYRTVAGICGESMSLRKNGEAGFIATLATEAVSGTQPVVFGKGFDIRSHWVSVGMPAESQEPPPLVGSGTCNSGGEACTLAGTSDICPSVSPGACCPNPIAECEGRKYLFDETNLHVNRIGSHPDYARCHALRTELADSSDAVKALAPNPAYGDPNNPERVRVATSDRMTTNCDEIETDPDACTAVCASACRFILGAGQQVIYVDSIDVKRNMALRLCRDFNLTESDPPTVAIVRIEDDFKLSPGARIESCGIPPDRILWNAEGEKGSVKFARGADLIGTVLAPRRKSIKFGGDATLKGSLFAPIVTFSKFTEMYHYPFSAGID